MVPIVSLWLPILVSSVVVFLVSFILHTVLKYHASDYSKLPNEEGAMDALRKFNIPDGDYSFPRASSMKEMGTPEFQEKQKKGPNGMLTIWGTGSASMGKELAIWFLYSVVIGVFAAYIAGRALGEGASYLAVFRFAGATAFFCYAVANWQESIWFKKKWSTTIKNTFDALVYALLTAGVFGWLWPR